MSKILKAQFIIILISTFVLLGILNMSLSVEHSNVNNVINSFNLLLSWEDNTVVVEHNSSKGNVDDIGNFESYRSIDEASDTDVISINYGDHDDTDIVKVETPTYRESIQYDGIRDWNKLDSEYNSSVIDRQYSAVSNSSTSKFVMGFAVHWTLPSYYKVWQYDKLSAIAYFSATCTDSGTWVTNDNGWKVLHSDDFADMVHMAHEHGTKVLLVVKNFHNRSIIELVDADNNYRLQPSCSQDPVNCPKNKLINNIINEIKALGLDGVNIDFEFREDQYFKNSQVRPALVSFMNELANKLHNEIPGSIVNLDVYAGSVRYSTAYDIPALANTAIDNIVVMSYDLYTTSYYTDSIRCPSSGKYAAPVAPLYRHVIFYDSSGNPVYNYAHTVDMYMKDFMRVIPNNKIIMGIPYYGLEFPTSGSHYNACTTGAGYIASYASIVDESQNTWHNPSTIKWNDTDKVTFYAYKYPDMNTGDQYEGYYDDVRSLSAKYDYVNYNNLGGIAIWALGYDRDRTELWDILWEYFYNGAFKIAAHGEKESSVRSAVTACGGQIINCSDCANGVVLIKPNSGLSYSLFTCIKKKINVSIFSDNSERFFDN